MKTILHKLFDRFRREDGSMAIEFVIMVPLFVAMISGVVDLSRIYVDQANYYNIARDTARIVARHGMTVDTAKEYAASRVTELSNTTPTVNVTSTTTDVTVTISAPVQVLAKFDFLDFLSGTWLSASVTHALEPN